MVTSEKGSKVTVKGGARITSEAKKREGGGFSSSQGKNITGCILRVKTGVGSRKKGQQRFRRVAHLGSQGGLKGRSGPRRAHGGKKRSGGKGDRVKTKRLCMAQKGGGRGLL